MEGTPREHEEFRLNLERQKEVQLAAIEAQKVLAEHQAHVLAAALEHAKINIVGGDGEFFQRFVHAVSLGSALDGAIGQSETAQKLFSGYLDGSQSFTDDVKSVLSKPAIDSEAMKNLSITAVLSQMLSKMEDGQRTKMQNLIVKAKELGL
jgi:hypothetical protein